MFKTYQLHKLGDMPIGYTSLQTDSFKDPPKDYSRPLPVMKKEDLLKSNFALGQEKDLYYQTAGMFQFQDPKKVAAEEALTRC